jgi:tetratricopeptide (TPR) repeat protein
LLREALRALERLPETPDTLAQAIDVRLELRVALIPLGRYHDVLAVMREAEGLATRLGDPARLGRVLADISARLRNVAGEHLQAIEVGRHALAIAAASGDRELELEAQYRTGQAYFAIGDYRQALDFLSRCAEGEGRRHPSTLFASWSHTWIALTLSSLGQFVDAKSHAQEALRIAEGADHPFTLAEAVTGIGSVALAQGDLDRAIDALERARVLVGVGNLQPWAVLARLGHAYALSGRPLEARALLEEVVRDTTTMSAMGVGRAMQLAWLGETYLLEGRLDDALETAQQAVSLAQRHRERSHEAWSLRLLGEIASHRDPPAVERAEGYYRETLALAGELRMRPLVAHCHFHLGTLLRKTGHPQASDHLATATKMYREMHMRLWQDQADAEMRARG